MGVGPNRNCIFVGAPGSGKGTQAKRIQEKFGIAHISTGDILRAEVNQGTALGLRVKEILAAGKLVDDALMLDIIRARFSRPDVQKGFILDGYPRNLVQAEALSKVFSELKIKNPTVYYFKMPKDLLVRRLTGRLSCSKCGAVFHREFNRPKADNVCDSCGNSPLIQRSDDTEDTAIQRLDVFENQTQPLLGYYQNSGQLLELDGSQDVELVTKALLQRLQ